MNETEIERLVVRLVGDAESYLGMIEESKAASAQAQEAAERAAEQERIAAETMRQQAEARRQQVEQEREYASAMREGEQLTVSLETASERFQRRLEDLNELVSQNAISQETMNRAITRYSDEWTRAEQATTQANTTVETTNTDVQELAGNMGMFAQINRGAGGSIRHLGSMIGGLAMPISTVSTGLGEATMKLGIMATATGTVVSSGYYLQRSLDNLIKFALNPITLTAIPAVVVGYLLWKKHSDEVAESSARVSKEMAKVNVEAERLAKTAAIQGRLPGVPYGADKAKQYVTESETGVEQSSQARSKALYVLTETSKKFSDAQQRARILQEKYNALNQVVNKNPKVYGEQAELRDKLDATKLDIKNLEKARDDAQAEYSKATGQYETALNTRREAKTAAKPFEDWDRTAGKLGERFKTLTFQGQTMAKNLGEQFNHVTGRIGVQATELQKATKSWFDHHKVQVKLQESLQQELGNRKEGVDSMEAHIRQVEKETGIRQNAAREIADQIRYEEALKKNAEDEKEAQKKVNDELQRRIDLSRTLAGVMNAVVSGTGASIDAANEYARSRLPAQEAGVNRPAPMTAQETKRLADLSMRAVAPPKSKPTAPQYGEPGWKEWNKANKEYTFTGSESPTADKVDESNDYLKALVDIAKTFWKSGTNTITASTLK